VAESLALAWANVRLRGSLHEQAVRDPLTGLYNRRHMQASLERALRRVAGADKPIGIMMLDIDDLKAINDAHGHDAGDVVLRELGRFLKEHTREGDTASRLGGEEFLVILPGATLEQTMVRAEKHRQQFAAVRILYAGGSIQTPTLSIGVAAYPKHGSTAEALLLAADRAVHAARVAGRDRVVAAE
jgi:diguanylate cyclase (GGDEF)-like protein